MTTAELLERGRELAVIDLRLAAAAAGEGGLLVIEGPAGIGKTALLRAALDAARATGMDSFCAWAAPLEQDLSFGAAREIFAAARAHTGPAEWDAATAGAAALACAVLDDAGRAALDSARAAAHGLYWLTANLAGSRPLVLAVDDLQWADAGSLHWLAYLTRRLEGLPVLVVVTVRSGEEGGAPDLLAEVLGAAVWEPLRPTPLGEQAACEVIRRELTEATDTFGRACHAATGGNPFLLRALATSLRAEGIEPTDAAALDVAEFGPGSVALALERRLARMPVGAGALLEAVAVLGPGNPVAHYATLARLEVDDAAVLLDALVAVGLLVPPALEFVHPVVRAAVTGRIGIGARGVAHGRAARLLAADGVPPDRLAPHLLAAHPAGDPWVVATLRTAARIANERGTPQTAESYLRRALAEPPEPASRPAVLHELGLALSARRDAQAPVLFLESLSQTLEAGRRGDLGLTAIRATSIAFRLREAFAIGHASLSDAASLDPATVLRIKAEMIVGAWMDAETAELAWDWVDRDEFDGRTGTPADGLALTVRGAAKMLRGQRSADAAMLIKDGLELASATEQGSNVLSFATDNLIYLDELDAADKIALEIRAQAHRLGSMSLVGHSDYFGSLVAFRRGDLATAGPGMRSCHEFNLSVGAHLGFALSLAHLVDIFVATGAWPDAEEALEDFPLTIPPTRHRTTAMVLESRGALRHAQGRDADALADLDSAASIWSALGATNPNFARWRAPMVRALARSGRIEEAGELARENLALAEATELPRAIGVALHALGLATGDLSRVEAAVAVLRGSPARLELAQALVDLGTALRHDGRRENARDQLRAGLDLAQRCGAKTLAESAHEELVIAGGRPRRLVRSGRESLTPAEHRVARLATEGLSNKEIAQRLFVSERTVETHLLHAFQKLSITSRAALAPALAIEAAAT